MLLRIRFPSPLAPNLCSSTNPSSLSPFSPIGSDQNPSCKDGILFFFSSSKSPALFSLCLNRHNRRKSGFGFLRAKYLLGSCRASTGNVSPEPDVGVDDDNDQYIQASLLVPATVKHYNLWKQGFIEETKWHSAAHKKSFASHRRGWDFKVDSIGHRFLRQFQSPTVFLKIACDGDLLLPIIVGEFAIIRLLDAINDEEHEECPDQFQFVKNIVATFGYERGNISGNGCIMSNCHVKMVRIAERVVNTYYARIYLKKTTDNSDISIDAGPSDALNVAERFKAPIYVNKEIVLKDAVKLVHGIWRARSTRMAYDLSLDSEPEEPDPLIEEFDLVQKMNMAVLEERFEDAVIWRDKLMKLRIPRYEL